MEKNSQDFSMQEAIKLANSPAGQQLFALLQQSDGDQLQKAMAQAAAGNYTQAKSAMSAMLSDPKVKALLEKMGR